MDDRGVAVITPNEGKKRILLLQGPIGPFYSALQKQLILDGHSVDHVIFNFADWFYSSRKNILIFRQTEDKWRNWIQQTLIDNKIDLVVVFGCERDRHGIAREVANQLSIPLLSLEEGYVRPGYVSAEMGGNNRLSPLRELSCEALKSKPINPIPSPGAGHSFNKMAWFGFFYYTLRVVGLPFFAHALHHKNRPILSEAFCWARNGFRKITRRSQNFTQIEMLLENYRYKYYIVPLQVRDDMQLVMAGRGWTNELLVEKAIKSFASHAPSERLLVFKVHPLERGSSNLPKLVKKTAGHYGCSSRVLCLDDGSIGLLARDSAAMLTINSSSAFSTMLRKVPLGVLGDAMFRRDDIAHCIDNEDDLNNFWKVTQSSKQKLAVNFRNHMRANSLVPGDFYLADCRQETAERISKFISERLPTGKRSEKLSA